MFNGRSSKFSGNSPCTISPEEQRRRKMSRQWINRGEWRQRHGPIVCLQTSSANDWNNPKEVNSLFSNWTLKRLLPRSRWSHCEWLSKFSGFIKLTTWSRLPPSRGHYIKEYCQYANSWSLTFRSSFFRHANWLHPIPIQDLHSSRCSPITDFTAAVLSVM